jgi:hypothetical protein
MEIPHFVELQRQYKDQGQKTEQQIEEALEHTDKRNAPNRVGSILL